MKTMKWLGHQAALASSTSFPDSHTAGEDITIDISVGSGAGTTRSNQPSRSGTPLKGVNMVACSGMTGDELSLVLDQVNSMLPRKDGVVIALTNGCVRRAGCAIRPRCVH